MPKVFDDFLGQVLSQIRCKQAHEGVRQELSSHLNDQAEAYESHGKDPETAMQEAVRQMGDPVIIGGQLDAVHRPRPDWFVLVLTMALVTGGSVLQLLMNMWVYYGGSSLSLVLGACLGMAALLILYFLDYTIIAKRPLILYIAVCAICLLPYLPVLAGTFYLSVLANHYISYSAFLFVPVFCGILYSRKGKGIQGLLACILAMLPPAAICIWSHNFSTFGMVYAACCILMITAIAKNWFGGRKLHLLFLLIIPVAVFFIAIAISPRGLDRLISLFSSDVNNHSDNLRFILGNAQLLGQSPVWQISPDGIHTGLLFQTAGSTHTIEMWYSSYWLTNLIGLYGWLPGIAVIAGIAVLLWRLFAEALRQKNALGYYVCLSVALLIAFQSITFILMNFGLIFGGENGLPFIFNRAYGMAVNMVLIGLYLSACKFGKRAYTHSFSLEKKAKA